ncbi:phage portal protein [Erythrobacter rubeus]|uniref:Phage portal protein n=1 Tax=Erythrobacter rubeus TaxID=2760803 RepID=A0ABR8KRX6_9SPHN|nr:phage portal protein [Erythrobacter rubeus]MBD2842699.1 phage portal protein [Erythrobacter rubeus]
MTGYRLSAQAAALEEKQQRQLTKPRKAVTFGQRREAAYSDGNNFRTNRVTVADYMDRIGRINPLGLSATFACVNLIAGTQASLKVGVYVPDENGVKREDRAHPLHWLLSMDPNFDQTAYEFIEFIGASLELHGNAYARIYRSGSRVVALEPVRPDIVRVRRRDDGALEYEWTADAQRIVVRQAEVLHIRGFGGNALGGASTLSMCAGAFGSAMDSSASARAIFANGVRPSGILETETALSGDQRAELEALLQEKFVGAVNSGKPMLLDNGLKWSALTLNPEDAQLLESRKFDGEEICRIFGVPPAMVGYGDKASNWGTGKEVDVLGFIKFALRKRLRRIEQALMKQLLTRTERQAGVTIEFNLEGLLRGDSRGRAEFYQIMVRLGLMTRNEARAKENLPPIEGGDVAMVQMQDVPLADAIDGDKE